MGSNTPTFKRAFTPTFKRACPRRGHGKILESRRGECVLSAQMRNATRSARSRVGKLGGGCARM